jgi:hypothetical protein
MITLCRYPHGRQNLRGKAFQAFPIAFKFINFCDQFVTSQ